MSSDPRPLRVLLVSQDVSLLHETSWFLEAVGYQVDTANDSDQGALWRRFSSAEFVIVDSRNIAEPAATTFAFDSDNPNYRIFLCDAAEHTDFAAWYAAGAHDALRTPISRGELLARLRTGARYLEFERRLCLQSLTCAIPGMYSRRGFLRKLGTVTTGERAGTSQHTLLVTSVDWYAGIRRKLGESASRNLVNKAARAVRRVVGESAVTAYLGDGRFAALLLGQAPNATTSVAEALATDFGCHESHLESVPRPTLTSAVVPWTGDCTPDHLLSDALKTLDLAEHSGGDCVVSHGEFSREYSAWHEEMSSGNPFVNVVAQDVMEPFPAVLVRGTQQYELAAALRRSSVPVRPYVDDQGRLVGVADADSAASELGPHRGCGSEDEPLTMPETIASDASFPEIFEAFSSRGCTMLIVTADEVPLGYITCDGFLSTIDPIHTQSYTYTDNSADELSFLVVPSTIGEADLEPANI